VPGVEYDWIIKWTLAVMGDVCIDQQVVFSLNPNMGSICERDTRRSVSPLAKRNRMTGVKRSRDKLVPRQSVLVWKQVYPAMYPDNSFDSRATTRGKRDVQRERDYTHKKGANTSVSID